MIDLTQLLARRFRDRAQFQVERLMLRGAQYRLLILLICIVVLALLGGGVVIVFHPEVSATDAFWWAFLRMTDAGHLAEDEGVLKRTLAVFLTVCGCVLLTGALIAIMTQWLEEKMRHLEMGLTPISKKNHLIILGWTNRTPDIVRDVMLSGERVERFLARMGISKLAIVILAPEVSSALYVEISEQLGKMYKRREIIMRSGTPLRIEHLNRVDFLNSAVIVLPAGDYHQPGTAAADTRTIKTLLSISRHAHDVKNVQPPLLVAELFDPRKVKLAERAYEGPIEIVSGDAAICKLMAQTVRHRGVSYVMRELLTQGQGNEIYVRDVSNYRGRVNTFGELSASFERAVAIGVVRWEDGDYRPILCPLDAMRIKPEDKVVLVARNLADCDYFTDARSFTRDEPAGAVRNMHRRMRILVLGWSRRLPPLLAEFDSYQNDEFHIDVFSRVELEQRKLDLRNYDFHPTRVRVEHMVGDYIVPSELERLNLALYDHILLVASDRLESEEESDARTLSGYLLLTELLTARRKATPILVELMDSQNAPLLAHFPHELLVSPDIISHMLVQVALRRELNAVLEELFGSNGSEISFNNAAEFGVAGRKVTFHEIEAEAHNRGQIALGVRLASERQDANGGTRINPDRSIKWLLGKEDDIIVLTARE